MLTVNLSLTEDEALMVRRALLYATTNAETVAKTGVNLCDVADICERINEKLDDNNNMVRWFIDTQTA